MGGTLADLDAEIEADARKRAETYDVRGFRQKSEAEHARFAANAGLTEQPGEATDDEDEDNDDDF